MKEKLLEVGSWTVEQARAKGAAAEAFLLHGEDLTVEVVDGQVETLKQSEEIGLGIRVFTGNRMGFAFTTDLDRTAVQETLEKALKGAKYTAEDSFLGLPQTHEQYPKLDTFDPAIESETLERKIEMAREVERQARATDKRVKVIERAGYEDSRYSVAVISSEGVRVYQKGAYAGLFVFVMAEENGDAQTGFSVLAKRRLKDLDPVFVGKEGANDAVRSLGAKTIVSKAMPCVLEPYVMTNFLGVIADSFSADAVQKGKSALKDKIGQSLGSQWVTIIDDGTLQEGISAFPFDGEGWPSQRTMLLDKGVLKGYLYDSYTARKDKTHSTGNGVRGSFRGLPSVGTTNVFLQPGSGTPEALISDIKQGLYITEVMGMHTANPISGDFSVGASGLMIENGKLTYPVRGATIAGNLLDFLSDIEGVASDLRFYGGTGSPTVRVKALSVGGD